MAADKWTDEFLNKMRTIGDPKADLVIDSVYKQGQVDAVNDVLWKLTKNDEPIPDDLPEVVKTYLKETEMLPSWTDPEKIKKGEDVFLRYLEIPAIYLACGSLPVCYSLKNGVQVLWMTQQLRSHVHRRILETAYLVIEVMNVGGLEPNGKGIRALQRVRLMHAAIRYLILLPPPSANTKSETFNDILMNAKWNPDFGHPINQEDLAFTMLSFSYIPIRSLSNLVTTLSDEEKDAYIYAWCVAGNMLGLNQELLPSTYSEAEMLFSKILSRQQGECEQGIKMERALLAFLRKEMIPNWLFPLKFIPRLITRTVIGDETADVLSIRKTNWLENLIIPVAAFFIRIIDRFQEKLYEDFPNTQVIGNWFSYRMLKKLSKLPRGGNRKLFALPEHLAATWKLK